MATDVSDPPLARSSADLARSQVSHLLVEVIEAIDESFAVFDADDRVVVCNSAFRRSWPIVVRPGVSLRALLESTLTNGRHPTTGEDGEAWIARIQSLHRGAGGRVEEVLHGGTLQINVSPLRDGWSAAHVRDLGTLVPLRKAIEAEGDATDAGTPAQRIAQSTLTRLSHSLRTPLNAIIGLTRQLRLLARQTPLTGRELLYLQRIELNGLRLLEGVNDLRDMSLLTEALHVAPRMPQPEAGRDAPRAPGDDG